VASVNGCIIFDLPGICRSSSSIAAFSSLMTRLLLSSSCTKLFYGCEQDMQKLRSSWPDVEAFSIGAHRCLELNHLASAVRANLRNKSLSDVCLDFLGQSLDKKQRLSNWALRPLATHQIVYAAIDVYAPLLVFDRIIKNIFEPVGNAVSSVTAERFESLFFDLQSVATGIDHDENMFSCATNSSTTKQEQHQPSMEVNDAIQCVKTLKEDIFIACCSDPVELPDESPESRVASPSQESQSLANLMPLSSLGSQRIIATLDKCGDDMVFELLNIPHVAGCGCENDSKFEFFDKTQLLADALGMKRCQVISMVYFTFTCLGVTSFRTCFKNSVHLGQAWCDFPTCRCCYDR
jgi:hypothetical protein